MKFYAIQHNYYCGIDIKEPKELMHQHYDKPITLITLSNPCISAVVTAMATTA